MDCLETELRPPQWKGVCNHTQAVWGGGGGGVKFMK
jgi:hypothetical protein